MARYLKRRSDWQQAFAKNVAKESKGYEHALRPPFREFWQAFLESLAEIDTEHELGYKRPEKP